PVPAGSRGHVPVSDTGTWPFRRSRMARGSTARPRVTESTHEHGRGGLARSQQPHDGSGQLLGRRRAWKSRGGAGPDRFHPHAAVAADSDEPYVGEDRPEVADEADAVLVEVHDDDADVTRPVGGQVEGAVDPGQA